MVGSPTKRKSSPSSSNGVGGSPSSSNGLGGSGAGGSNYNNIVRQFWLRLALLVVFIQLLLIINIQLGRNDRLVSWREAVGAEHPHERLHPHFPTGAPVPHPYLVDVSKFTDRQRAVVKAIRHAWQGYKDCAWGHDMLRTDGKELAAVGGSIQLVSVPCGHIDWGHEEEDQETPKQRQTNRHSGSAASASGGTKHSPSSGSGIGVTLIESLDTLWLAGGKREFYAAVEWLQHEHTFDVDVDVSLFETTIRVLGGLLSAYELSGDLPLLDKAYDIGERLLAAFHGDEIIPVATVNLKTHKSYQPTFVGEQYQSLAEVTTIQLEFKKLTYWTGDDRFDELASRIMPFVMKGVRDTPQQLPGIYVSRSNGGFDGRRGVITLGARGDSFYEYAVKQWILTNRTDGIMEKEYSELRTAIGNHLIVQVSDGRYFLSEANYYSAKQQFKMDHLACFAVGMFLLGRDSDRGRFYHRDTELAEAIGQTCYEMYNLSATGLAPEIVKFGPAPDYKMYFGAWHYILRPEAIEAMFYLKRFTGDQKWGDYAWKMFEAIDTHLKMKNGYSGVHNVSAEPSQRRLPYNFRMESFFIAETLKYALLSQEDPHLPSDERLLPFRQWVFNTEGHPFRVIDPQQDPLRFGAYNPEHVGIRRRRT